MFTKDLLESLVDGPAMIAGWFAKNIREEIILVRAHKKKKPYTAQEWQFIANGIAHPACPCPPRFKKVAMNLKDAVKETFSESDFRQSFIEQIKDYDKDKRDRILAEFDRLIQNWDWEMFANGLIASNE